AREAVPRCADLRLPERRSGGARTDRRGRARDARARAALVAGFFLHSNRVAHVAGHGHIRLAGGAGDRGTVVAFAIAPQPLVAEARRDVRPRAAVLGQGLALLRCAGDRGRRCVHRGRRHDDGRLHGGGWAARAAFVAGGLLDPDRVPDVFGDEHIRLVGGAGDGGAAVAFN